MKKQLLFLFLTCTISAQAQIVTIQKDNIINVSTWGDAALLADENQLSGDPKSGNGGTPVTKWAPGWTDWYYPASVVIDLGGIYNLTDIYFYDSNGSGDITFYAGTPFAWDSLFTDNQATYNQWSGHTVSTTTRYIQLTLWTKGAVPNEIVLYGSSVETTNDSIATHKHQRPLLNDFIGINAFIDDPVEAIAAAGFVREYHNWSFTEVGEQEYEYNRWNGFWDFDTYYDTLKNLGITVAPCIQSTLSMYSAPDSKKPVTANEKANNPASYAEHSRMMYQYAGRYGSTTIPDNMISVANGQTAKTGLRLITYYENWNEQDAWWHGRDGWFSPYEYAAMASADIDGHQGLLGPGHGIKTADPHAKLVMGGTAKLDLEYVKAIQFWSQFNRNGSFPADVLNFHHYSNDNGGQGTSTKGIHPEADSLKERIKKLVDFRDSNLPDKELWITEFGYDTHVNSIQRAEAYGSFSSEEVQAMWLIRSYLAIAAAGADKAAMYMLRDVDETDKTKYSTSGLVTKKGEWNKKPSWYYVYTLRNLLGDYFFDQEIASNNSDILIYQFKHAETEAPAYILWCPTADGTVINDYNFAMLETFDTVNTIGFSEGKIFGDSIETAHNTSTLQLTVSENPIIVKVSPRRNKPLDIALHEGINLLSHNKNLDKKHIDAFFGVNSDKIISVKNLAAFYHSDLPEYLCSLQSVDQNSGYIVESTEPFIITVTGEQIKYSGTSVSLKKGWNLIGIPYSAAKSISETFSSVTSKLQAVKTTESFYIPGNNLSALTAVEPGKAYFVQVSSNCTLEW